MQREGKLCRVRNWNLDIIKIYLVETCQLHNSDNITETIYFVVHLFYSFMVKYYLDIYSSP